MRQNFVIASFVAGLVSIAVWGATPSTPQVALGESCSQQRERLIVNSRRVASPFAAGCNSDLDCTVIDPSVQCQVSCPVAIVATRATAFKASLLQFEATNCSSPILASCGAMPTCAVSLNTPVACQAGTCVLRAPASNIAPTPSNANFASNDAG